MGNVALVRMPWGIVKYASLALGVLKGALIKEEIPTDVFYLNLRFAKLVNTEAYSFYSEGNPLLGEWVFGQWLNDEYQPEKYKETFQRLFSSVADIPEMADFYALLRLKKKEFELLVNRIVPTFITESLNAIDWGRYTAVGFTCTMGEYASVLLLSKYIKKSHPKVKIIIGGPNVTDIVGLQTLKDFPWVDYIIDGEGEVSLPKLIKNLDNGKYFDEIPGVYFRKGNEIIAPKPSLECVSLDDSPIPDFSEYYMELKNCGFNGEYGRILPFESSRGCWWGEKSQCSFCAVNTNRISYKSKSCEKTIDELITLSKSYDFDTFFAMDSILNYGLIDNLLPRLKESNISKKIVYQVKPNLSKDQLVSLYESGITEVFAGIESLDTELLKYMNKGVTAIKNIQFLKFCSEIGLKVDWNFLYKIPGETEENYKHMLATIPLLMHFDPPEKPGRITLDRFSSYHKYPEKYGISSIQPDIIYESVFSGLNVGIDNIAHIFSFDCESLKMIPTECINSLFIEIEKWQKLYEEQKCYCIFTDDGSRIEIIDNRPLNSFESTDSHRKIVYEGIERRIYLYCNEVRTFKDVYIYFNKDGIHIPEEDLKEILNKFLADHLMITENNQYLGLAVKKILNCN